MDSFRVLRKKWLLFFASIYLILQFDGLLPVASFYRVQNLYFYKKVSEQTEENSRVIQTISTKMIPVFSYAGYHPVTQLTVEEKEMLEKILQEEAIEGIEVAVDHTDAIPQDTIIKAEEEQMEKAKDSVMTVIEENAERENEEALNSQDRIKNGSTQIRQTFQKETFTDYDSIVKQFYTIDSTTEPAKDQISYENLLERDLSLEHKNEEGEPAQILIYHTHSQEQFVDSIPGDMATGVVGAGEYLAQILREKYGYQVMHHLGTYDIEGRAHAYSNAEPEIEKLLAENPDIEVVIDLHRDAVAEGKKLVTNIDGVTMAKFMFFNGLSYTKELGRITYLENPYIDENLAFAFQMDITAEAYYPGITRKIYLKGYRYNMHFRGKSLLIELGAQTNTMQEIWNAVPPIADTLDHVLSGRVSDIIE